MVLALVLPAASPWPANATDSAQEGKALYLKYCGACHGPAGKGDGIAGTIMRPKPTDLTGIARRNGGTFPYEATMHAIDGARTLRAHGDPDMPVWGEVFRSRAGGSMGQQDVHSTLARITEYLRSIQEP